MTTPLELEGFQVSEDDPLAAAHATVAAWAEEAIASCDAHRAQHGVDLKTLPGGKKLLAGKPGQLRCTVLAAMAQDRHWRQVADRIHTEAGNGIMASDVPLPPAWREAWKRRSQAEMVVTTLLRRALPFEAQDLVVLLQWSAAASRSGPSFDSLGDVGRALERYAAATPVDAELRAAMAPFVARLRSSYRKEDKRLATALEQFSALAEAESAPDPKPGVETQPRPAPAPAGSAGVLPRLKQLFGMRANEAAPSVPVTVIEPDRFALSENTPLRLEHELLSPLIQELMEPQNRHNPDFNQLKAGRELLALEPPAMGRALLAAAERHVHSLLASPAELPEVPIWQAYNAAVGTVANLLPSHFQVDRDGFFDLLLYLSTRPTRERVAIEKLLPRLIAQAESEAEQSPLTGGERYVLSLFRASLISGPPLGVPSANVTRLSRLINDGAGFYLVPGEAWSDAVNGDLSRLDPARRAQWAAILKHALTATPARPTPKWLETAAKLVQAIGGDAVRQALVQWLPQVARGQTIRRLSTFPGDVRSASDVMNEENATCLRGFLWLVQTLPGRDDLARLITAVALSAYKKVPGVGPRAVKVGNGAVYALAEMASTDAVGQLAMLKVRVKFGTAQKEIKKAFTTAAEALGLPRDQIEEMGVPSYGLEEVGLRRESFGDYRAGLIVTGSDAELKWLDGHGKSLKSVPARVKEEHKDDLKELQQSLKDIQAMLPAQRDRIDAMFLLQKTWPLEEWRERYLDHPLIGTIARRLLWCVDGTPALFIDGQPTDVQGAAIDPRTSAPISLWSPVGRRIEEITGWRRTLEERGITQPFKQAHREVYLLTDAERNTRTYSNRFAAHVLRQHQFNALCAARGWKNKLRLMVDDTHPPATRELPQWGLRAEFWIEGIGGDDVMDTNEAGVYLRLATDQVRFYAVDAARHFSHASGGGYLSNAHGPGRGDINAPLPLEQVPAQVFSEVMRDVDLFVGVASVGNDPTWQDGGPQGRYQEYWQRYSFGELSGTATTRRQVLERLVPRLKIAARCSFSDRFLVVRGEKRTYKIHLGSGNILMEPNDEYLCIVPDSPARATQGDLFLPFEGDSTLSIIISKALLLAEDAKIKDATITRQIDRR